MNTSFPINMQCLIGYYLANSYLLNQSSTLVVVYRFEFKTAFFGRRYFWNMQLLNMVSSLAMDTKRMIYIGPLLLTKFILYHDMVY